MSLDKKTLFKIWRNPGLNLSIFWGTVPWSLQVINLTTISRAHARELVAPRFLVGGDFHVRLRISLAFRNIFKRDLL